MGIRAWTPGIVLGTLFCACACGGGGGSGEPPGDGPPTPITVSGTVLKQEAYGAVTQPDVGVTVVVIGEGEAITDAAGRFVVPDVTPPYDAIVLDDRRTTLAIYQGLTRDDPILRGTDPDAGSLLGSAAAGYVTGGVGWPLPVGYETIVAWSNADRPPTGRMFPSDSDGSYSYLVNWFGEATIPLAGVALQYRQTFTGPTAYTGFGTATGLVANGIPLTGMDIELAPIDAQTVAGTIEIPTGYGAAALGFLPIFDAGPMLFVGCGNRSTGPFDVLVPHLPGATHWMQLVGSVTSGAQGIARRIVAPGDSRVALQLPEVIDPLLPMDGATGVTHETTFAVTEIPDGVVRVRYAPTGGTDGPILWLTAASGSWQIPDLSTYDVLIPPGSQYSWRTWGYGPATVDDLCDPTPFTERSPHWETNSGWFEFTTGP